MDQKFSLPANLLKFKRNAVILPYALAFFYATHKISWGESFESM